MGPRQPTNLYIGCRLHPQTKDDDGVTQDDQAEVRLTRRMYSTQRLAVPTSWHLVDDDDE